MVTLAWGAIVRGSKFILIWLALSTVLGLEYLSVHFNMKWPSLLSLMLHGKKHGASLKAGDSISFFFGWLGFALICLTNLYVMKKRFNMFESMGTMKGWLDFHIFCGLMGPTFILFHCDFKVRGLVAISFWSMIISFSSGVVGRYFYTQLIGTRESINNRIAEYEKNFIDFAKSNKFGINASQVQNLKTTAMQLAFGGMSGNTARLPIAQVLASSVVGDMNLFFAQIGQAEHIPPFLSKAIKEYAVFQRRNLTLENFRKMMGYWHTFHVPFAVFMYFVAVIHIISSLIFRVK